MRVDGFFEAIADEGEFSERWYQLVSGLAVVRVVERPRSVIARVKAEEWMDEVTNTTLRGHLERVLRAVLPSDDEPYAALAPQLMAWGLWLHADGQYRAAANVFEAAETVDSFDSDTRLQAILRAGFAYRMSQKFDEAERAYRRLVGVAIQFDDTRMRLEGLLGIAKVVGNRGNIPAAEPLVDAVMAEARDAGILDVLRKCYIQRAYIAGKRLQPDRAIEFSYLSLDGMTDPFDRDIAYLNISIALREVDEGGASAQMSDYLATRSAFSQVRIDAALNRYHVAIDTSNWETTSRIRRILGSAKLTPGQALEFYETVARERARRDEWSEAETMLERMLAIAEDEKLAEQIIRADAALASVRKREVPIRFAYSPSRPATSETQKAVAAVVSAVPALCEV